MERNTFFCNLGLYIKSVLVFILLLGGSGSAWADDIVFFSNTSNTLTGWTTNNISTYSYSPYYLYTNSTGTITSNETLVLSSYRKLTIRGRRYIGSSADPYITVKYSSDGETWSTSNTYTSVLESDSYQDLVIDLTGTYYIKLECYKIRIETLKIAVSDPYPAPTNFTVGYITTNSAKFSWTAGNSEETWQFDYSEDPNFTPGNGNNGTSVSITTNPYTLTGLTTGTTYYASIRADYGSGNYSEWTDKISFTPREIIEATINDGNTNNGYLPFYGSGANGITNSQFIIPSSSLGEVNGRQITKLVFYSYNANKTWGKAEFEVYIKETSKTTFSTADYDSWGTCVYNSASLSVDANKLMTINLSTPYNYQGGNLQIGFKLTKTGSSNYNSFYGVNGSNYTSVYGSGLTSESRSTTKFSPKVTITTVPITTAPVQMDNYGFTTFASPYPLDLTKSNMPDGLTAYRAAEVDAGKSIVRFTSDINQTVQANTGILLKGRENTTYSIPVVASGTALGDNALLVNEKGGTFTGDGDYTYFAMKKNSNPLTFGTFNPSTTAIPSNKAYLKVPSGSGARTLRFVFDDNETTGIKNVDAHKTSSKDIYFNLNGQRVAKPTKGMYISNGKKYIVK